MQKELRLKRKQDFRKVYTYGKSVANRELVLFIKENPQLQSYRFGISVSKKIGNAVVRNRVKRYIKEVIRLFIDKHDLQQHKDFVIIARKPTATMEFGQFERSVKDIFRKSNVLNRKKRYNHRKSGDL